MLKEIHHYESVDANGLMLTSQKSTDTNPSTFVWRGNDLVQETAPDGTVSHYNVVNGVLVSFERAGVTYTVQSDAKMGHVRSVTDSNGTVVYTARYDAWGNLLAGTDNVPGGMPYGFVGAFGVRMEATTGLYYMRHRWYDPGLQQFMSVDPLKSNADLYEYANDSPLVNVDPSGLDGGSDPWIGPSERNSVWIYWNGVIVPGPYGHPDPKQWGQWCDIIDDTYVVGGTTWGRIEYGLVGTAAVAVVIASGMGAREYAGFRTYEEAEMWHLSQRFGRGYRLQPNARPRLGIPTTKGPRFPDWLYRIMQNEVKKGAQRLNERLKKQILKDAELIARGYKIEWHFYRDLMKFTHSVDKALLRELTKRGIPYFFH